MTKTVLKSRRGSLLITAMFFLLLMVLLGAGLLTWGIWNVQSTVNTRQSTQAYYGAKSLCDTIADALDQYESADPNESAAAQKIERQMYALGATAGASAEYTPAFDGASAFAKENGYDFALRYTTQGVAGTLDDGVQTVEIAATCTYAENGKAYTRTVKRTVEITRRPGGTDIGNGFIGGKNGLLQATDYLFRNVTILGNVYVNNARTIEIENAVFTEDVFFAASEKIHLYYGKKNKPSTFGNADSKIVWYAPQIILDATYTEAFAAGRGADFYTDSIRYAGGMSAAQIKKMNIRKSSYEQPPASRDYRLKEFPTYGVEYNMLNRPAVITQSCNLYNILLSAYAFGGTFEVDTGGRDIGITVENGLTMWTSGRIVVRGGGSVTFYVEDTINLQGRMERYDNTKVTFISKNGDILMDGVSSAVFEANFLCPNGTFILTANKLKMHGSFWCGKFIANGSTHNSDFDFSTQPTEQNWWGDVSAFVELDNDSGTPGAGGSGGAQAGITVDTTPKYVK